MDKRKLANYTREEEAEWLKKEMLNEEATSLFSMDSTWFRFSKYEIITHTDYKDMLYIVPEKGSTIEKYKPFDEFPNILADFMEMLSNLNSALNLARESQILLEFVNKYGLFGLFWNDVQKISFTRTDSGIETLVYLKSTPRSPKYKEINERIKGASVDYNTYANLFLPRLKKPYPISVPGMGEEGKFYSNYGEPVKYIVNNPNLKRLISHLVNYVDFKRGNYKADDTLPHDSKHTWADILKTDIDGIGLKSSYKDNRFQLSWRYNSLLDALSIMYSMNLTNQMGQEVKTCQIKECNKAFIGKGKYCCKKHADTDRKRREREREREKI